MMIRLFSVRSSCSEEFRFVSCLLLSAFPREERREIPDFASIVDSSSVFHCCLVCDGDTPVGLVTYWELNGFCYIEHLAMLPECRGRGYGSHVLACLKVMQQRPIVLEVEHPEDETSRRRIAFYERQGFVCWQHEYLQPPYREGDAPLPLCLMVYGDWVESDSNFLIVRDAIYSQVYSYLSHASR